MNVCDQQEASLQALQVMLCFTASLFRRPLTSDACAYLATLELEGDDVLYRAPSCRRGLAALSDQCADSEAVVQTSVEFHRLFVGPHHVPCPPWGSIYLDEGRLFGPLPWRWHVFMHSSVSPYRKARASRAIISPMSCLSWPSFSPSSKKPIMRFCKKKLPKKPSSFSIDLSCPGSLFSQRQFKRKIVTDSTEDW